MDLPILIILAVVCIIIGYLLDNLIRNLREGGEKVQKAGSDTPESTNGELPSPLGESVEPVPTNPTPALVNVLHVWRDPQTQGIILETGGKSAHSPGEFNQEELTHLITVRNELDAWLGLPSLPAAPPELASRPLLADQRLEEQVDVSDGQPERVARPSLNPIDVISNAFRAEVRKPSTVASKSLATQVDEVLQEKLREQPTPQAKRGIRLLDGPDQDLLVQVGLEKYASVEDVPDEEIREMIREAVAEWGRRNALRK